MTKCFGFSSLKPCGIASSHSVEKVEKRKHLVDFSNVIQSTKPNSIWSIFKLTVVFDNIILLVMNECILIFVKLFSHNTANVWRCLMIQKASWCFSVFETQQCVVIQFLFYTRKTYLLHLIFCTSICPPPPHTTPAMSFSLLQPDFKLN